MFGKNKPGDIPSRASRRARNDQASREGPSAGDTSDRYAFRRNRTITGSSSARVASSNELNAELRSPRAHVHHLTSLRRRLLGYFSIVSLVAFGLYVLVFQLVATMTIRLADSAPSLPEADRYAYERAIESYYAARPAERFRFILDEPALLSHVQSARPEVRTVRIEPGSGPGEASVVISARNPIARWSIDGSNQYVDGEGVVFTKNYFTDPRLRIVDNSGLGASSSRLVASNRFLGFIGRVVAMSGRSGLNVERVTIPALTTRQVALTLKGSKTEYKLSVDRSAGQQVEDITRIAKYLARNDLDPGYVDVRISGKAFYK